MVLKMFILIYKWSSENVPLDGGADAVTGGTKGQRPSADTNPRDDKDANFTLQIQHINGDTAEIQISGSDSVLTLKKRVVGCFLF